jgi:hypothetical protein
MTTILLNNLKKKIKIDILSDLHIDHWTFNYKTKYPCGIIKNIPFKNVKTESNYLIVAGDISDNIYNSIEYLNILSENYEKILFVDGNHEHINKYPELYDTNYINSLINNEKIIYLTNKPYIIDKTVFLGACGWWDYNNLNNIEKCTNYFKNWINHFTKNDNMNFINNVIKQSKKECENLHKLLNIYQTNNNINNIVLITHTVPYIEFCDNDKEEYENDNFSTQYNTQYNNLLKYNKISHWIFGHAHQDWDKIINNIRFVSNPRGRPDDFNREEYSIKQIII